MRRRVAAITGVTGQDGSLLSEYLLKLGYEVHGLRRRSSSFNTKRLEAIYSDPFEKKSNFYLHYGDMTDFSSLIRFLSESKPDEIYNLAAQSHVAVSFETPEYTANADGLGTLRLLEALKISEMLTTTRFYQASTSEIFGGIEKSAYNENSHFRPRSPYAISKLFAHWTTVNYREAYGAWAVNGILFNHESERRGETFVTRKITRGLSRIKLGLQTQLVLGNLDAVRDWGSANDYVKAMHLMLQQKSPEDFVIATGHTFTVREFVQKVADILDLRLNWSKKGDFAVDQKGSIIVKTDPGYLRPTEVNYLLGDATRAREILGWTPETTFENLVSSMTEHDLDLAKIESRKMKDIK